MECESKYQFADGFVLKIIAVVSMFTDHVGAVLLPQYHVLRCIGRLAFPIYCFLLIEGLFHTSDVRRYLTRMGIFALISEVPFDLAFRSTWFYTGYQNVFFTLFIGLAVAAAAEKLQDAGKVPDIAAKLLPLLTGCAAAAWLHTDYAYSGVLIIWLFYMMRMNRLMCFLLVGIACFAMGGTEMWAVLAFIPIALYNGERGYSNRVVKYGFYAFYPVHLAIIAGIAGHIVF